VTPDVSSGAGDEDAIHFERGRYGHRLGSPSITMRASTKNQP
jgi:hypothetical protein